MTITNTTNNIIHIGSGSLETEYSFPFPVSPRLGDQRIFVYLRDNTVEDAAWILQTDNYTVTSVTDYVTEGGYITFDEIVPTTYGILITRELELNQPYSFRNSAINHDSLERCLDDGRKIDIQQQEEIDRALITPPASGIDPEIPPYRSGGWFLKYHDSEFRLSLGKALHVIDDEFNDLNFLLSYPILGSETFQYPVLDTATKSMIWRSWDDSLEKAIRIPTDSNFPLTTPKPEDHALSVLGTNTAGDNWRFFTKEQFIPNLNNYLYFDSASTYSRNMGDPTGTNLIFKTNSTGDSTEYIELDNIGTVRLLKLSQGTVLNNDIADGTAKQLLAVNEQQNGLEFVNPLAVADNPYFFTFVNSDNTGLETSVMLFNASTQAVDVVTSDVTLGPIFNVKGSITTGNPQIGFSINAQNNTVSFSTGETYNLKFNFSTGDSAANAVYVTISGTDIILSNTTVPGIPDVDRFWKWINEDSPINSEISDVVAEGQYLTVNSAGNALEWRDLPAPDLERFIRLPAGTVLDSNVINDGLAGQVLTVTTDNTGLEFTNPQGAGVPTDPDFIVQTNSDASALVSSPIYHNSTTKEIDVIIPDDVVRHGFNLVNVLGNVAPSLGFHFLNSVNSLSFGASVLSYDVVFNLSTLDPTATYIIASISGTTITLTNTASPDVPSTDNFIRWPIGTLISNLMPNDGTASQYLSMNTALDALEWKDLPDGVNLDRYINLPVGTVINSSIAVDGTANQILAITDSGTALEFVDNLTLEDVKDDLLPPQPNFILQTNDNADNLAISPLFHNVAKNAIELPYAPNNGAFRIIGSAEGERPAIDFEENGLTHSLAFTYDGGEYNLLFNFDTTDPAATAVAAEIVAGSVILRNTVIPGIPDTSNLWRWPVETTISNTVPNDVVAGQYLTLNSAGDALDWADIPIVGVPSETHRIVQTNADASGFESSIMSYNPTSQGLDIDASQTLTSALSLVNASGSIAPTLAFNMLGVLNSLSFGVSGSPYAVEFGLDPSNPDATVLAADINGSTITIRNTVIPGVPDTSHLWRWPVATPISSVIPANAVSGYVLTLNSAGDALEWVQQAAASFPPIPNAILKMDSQGINPTASSIREVDGNVIIHSFGSELPKTRFNSLGKTRGIQWAETTGNYNIEFDIDIINSSKTNLNVEILQRDGETITRIYNSYPPESPAAEKFVFVDTAVPPDFGNTVVVNNSAYDNLGLFVITYQELTSLYDLLALNILLDPTKVAGHIASHTARSISHETHESFLLNTGTIGEILVPENSIDEIRVIITNGSFEVMEIPSTRTFYVELEKNPTTGTNIEFNFYENDSDVDPSPDATFYYEFGKPLQSTANTGLSELPKHYFTIMVIRLATNNYQGFVWRNSEVLYPELSVEEEIHNDNKINFHKHFLDTAA